MQNMFKNKGMKPTEKQVVVEPKVSNPLIHMVCCNPSFGLATKAKGVTRLRAKRKEARESRQRHCKSVGQEEARESRRNEAWESHHIFPGVQESVRECEGVNTHTPKATPTLGDEVPVDFRNFRERLQGSKLNGSWRSLYHWKALGA